MFFGVVLLVVIAVTVVVSYYKWSYKYWKRKNVEFLEPKFPFGNMENPFSRKQSFGQLVAMYYNEFKKRGCKYGGLFSFTAPIFIPISPEMIKNVMQADFQYFTDRANYFNEKMDPLSGHLFNIGGQKWRKLRVKLTPTFTSGKMKMMFDTLLICSDQMSEHLKKLPKKHVDVKEIVARFTTDIIGCCAFGLECNSFKHPDAEFRKHGKNIFAPQSKLKAIGHIIGNASPDLGHFLGIYILPKVSTRFFSNVIKETVEFRETNNYSRNDMLQLMINIKNSEKQGLTMNEVAAQALVFFLAGFETSSTTMTFCLFELALHQDIQEKVRKEIKAILDKHEGKVTYDSITEMNYLGQVVDETLRKYPALPLLTRRCVQDYTIPGTKTVIEKGTFVFLPIEGVQSDPEYYPEPEKFDPERFSEKNRKNIVPFTYIPFGEGPRMCIGLRFGMMQTKLGLIGLLRDYKFTLSTRTSLPLKTDPYSVIVQQTKGTIFMDLEKIS